MSKPYASLTVPEQWEWHARVYAFRRVVLDVDPDMRTSPVDPEGKWFDAALVDEAERRLRNKRAARYARRDGDAAVWEARDIEDNWARDRGYRDFEHYKQVERIDHVEACCRVAQSFIAGIKLMPTEADYRNQTAGAA